LRSGGIPTYGFPPQRVQHGTWSSPPRRHLELDAAGIPNGDSTRERAESAPIGRRIFDDLYELGADRHLALRCDGAAVELRSDDNYPFAQVWVPPRRAFAALEPMTVATNALVDGNAPYVSPGSVFTASFTLSLIAP